MPDHMEPRIEPSQPVPKPPSKEDQFTTALMGMVGEYLLNHSTNERGPSIQRLDETRFAYMFGNTVMEISVKEMTDAIPNVVNPVIPVGFNPSKLH